MNPLKTSDWEYRYFNNYKNEQLIKSQVKDHQYAYLHNREGNILYGQKKYAEAILEYDEGINYTPKIDIYYTNKAAAFNALFRHTEALTCANTALTLNPTNTYALTQKTRAEHAILDNQAEQLNLEGVELFNTHQYTKAAAKFETAYEKCINSRQKIIFQINLAMALTAHGNILFSEGNFEMALRYYDLAMNVRPEAVYHVNIANTLNVLSRYTEALAWANTALILQPNNTYALMQKTRAEYAILDDQIKQLNLEGIELYNTKQYAKAAIKFETAYEKCINPHLKTTVQINLAMALNAQGTALYIEKNFEMALRYYDSAINAKPEAAYYVNKAGTLNALFRHEEVLIYATKALTLHPKNTYALTQKCIAEFGIDDQTKQLNLEGIELYNNKQYAKAAIKFETAYEKCINPHLKTTFQTNLAKAFNAQGDALYIERNFDMALRYYDSAINVKPEVACYVNKAGVLNALFRHEEALT